MRVFNRGLESLFGVQASHEVLLHTADDVPQVNMA